MWRRAAQATAGLLLLGGCTGRPNVFPIGLYNIQDPALIERVKEAGFDHILAVGSPEQVGSVAKEARHQGLKVLASPELSMDARQTKNWPVAAWYLQDEPDVNHVNHVSPVQLKEKSDRVRQWDVRTQAFVVGQGAQARAYGAIADVFMLDWYPVPQMAIDSVADQLDTAVSLLPPGKPLWFVVQAFDWKDYKRPIGRFPDHAEIRFMSWLAIFHGAKGLFFSRLDRPDGSTLFEYPELWQAVERVSRELKGFQPILEGGAPSPLPFPPNPDSVEARSWRYHGRQYVAVLNRKKGAYQKLPEELLKSRWRPLFALRRDVKDLLKPLNGAWYMKPYQVLVFEGPLFVRF